MSRSACRFTLAAAAMLAVVSCPAALGAGGGGHGPASSDRKTESKAKPGHDEASSEDDALSPIAKCYQALRADPEKEKSGEAEHGGDDEKHHAPHDDAAESGEHEKDAEAKSGAEPESAEKHAGEGHADGAAPPHEADKAAPDAGHAAKPDSAAPAVPAAPAPPPVEQPYQLVRTLEILQDKIAAGNAEAGAYQRELISQIAKKLPLVSDADWREPRNSRAAIVYALSGGDPGVLAKLLSLSPLPCIEENLIKGLLDYSQGRNPQAWALLSKIDPNTLDPRAAGHLALAQAMLIANDAPKKAMVYLDIARIQSPGTLVEEAALRREAVIAAAIQDLPKFEMLASQYLRRFNKSIYADDFIQRFAVAVTTSQYADNAKLFERLAETLDSLGAEQRLAAYLGIAEAGIVRGRIQLTRLAAQKLAVEAKDDQALALKARLYEAAVLLATDDYEQGAKQLKSIDPRPLLPRDRSLYDAALSLANRIRMPLPADLVVTEPPPVSAEQGKSVELLQMPKVVDSAKTAIGRADELLNGDRQ
jgi:chemotaxis protein MotC